MANQWRARTEKERIPNCRSPVMSGTSFNNAITRPKRLKKPTGAQQRSGSDDQPSTADGSEPAAAAATVIACAQKPAAGGVGRGDERECEPGGRVQGDAA